MQRYFLEIAYDGTNYHGWQVQPGVVTIQQVIEECLTRLNSNRKVWTLGCGRTDTGVHARQFYLHFDIDALPCDEEMFMFKLNRMLPDDISVYNIHAVDGKAHARFDATSRTYEYHINPVKEPRIRFHSWNYWHGFDMDAMNIAAQNMMKYTDFASFCKSGTGSSTTICYVTEARWEKIGERYVFTITANRFLRNMVRATVGTLMKVGRGVITQDEFCQILERRNRSDAGESVPPQGLFLTNVTYPYIRAQKR